MFHDAVLPGIAGPVRACGRNLLLSHAHGAFEIGPGAVNGNKGVKADDGNYSHDVLIRTEYHESALLFLEAVLVIEHERHGAGIQMGCLGEIKRHLGARFLSEWFENFSDLSNELDDEFTINRNNVP